MNGHRRDAATMMYMTNSRVNFRMNTTYRRGNVTIYLDAQDEYTRNRYGNGTLTFVTGGRNRVQGNENFRHLFREW